MSEDSASRDQLTRGFAARLAFFLVIWAVVFFLPAGTFAFWQAWVVLAILFIPMAIGYAYYIKQDPALVARRSAAPEKQGEQKRIIQGLSLLFVLTFLIPGLDRRFGWSTVPVGAVVAADILLALGYGICFQVVRENRFASRTVQVEDAQPVITTGLYALVRHPMYLGVLLMCLALPLALGSAWALLPALSIIPVLVARIHGEERTLVGELAGYREYMQQTRHRLVPGVW